MAKLDSYLMFNGTCAEAVRFYEKTLGAKVEMTMTVEESPMAAHVPPGNEKKIVHTRMTIDDQILMASDWISGDAYPGMHGFSLSLTYKDSAEAKRNFEALAAGGKIVMPIGPTFWAEMFGMLKDQYGTPWMISGPSTN